MPNNPTPTIEPMEYLLQKYGMAEPIKVFGAVTQLLPRRNVPIIFLIDENHGSVKCIEQNLANAGELVQKAAVTLIGVESRYGGQEWDDSEGSYKRSYDAGDKLVAANTCTTFADRMSSSAAKVRGVECFGLVGQMECESLPGGSWHGKPIKDHPLNEIRSEHFVRTVLELRSSLRLTGNIILNAGGNHNSHIEGWVRDGTIEAKARQEAAYVRVRAPAYTE